MTSRRLVLLSAVLTLTALGACSGSDRSDDGPEPAASSATPTTDPSADVDESAGCALLSAAERKKLVGSVLDTVVASDARAGGIQCRWAGDAGLVQVTDLAAQDWAKTLPDAVAQVEKSIDLDEGDNREQLAKARKLFAQADSFTGAEACRAFGTLAEISGDDGADGDARTTLTYLPISEDEVGISAQTCTGGRLTSIVYSAPDLTESGRDADRVRAALRAAHRRATAG